MTNKYDIDDKITIMLLIGKIDKKRAKYLYQFNGNTDKQWISFIKKYNNRIRKAIKKL